MSGQRKKNVNIFLLIFLDIIGIGAGLVIYALFHHALPRKLQGDGIVVSRPGYVSSSEITSTSSDITLSNEESRDSSSADETTSKENSETDEISYEPISSEFGMWGEKFRDKFTSGESIITDNQYISNSINIKITRYSDGNLAYYLADIYVKNIDNFKTALAEDSYGMSITDGIVDMANDNNAIVATNGDYYGVHDSGLVIRNGVVYRSATYDDTCVIYYDGTMKTHKKEEFDINEAVKNGAYQGWTFGPTLVRDGVLLSGFEDYAISDKNPRTAIGYYEPGHYCLITVDGRARGYSDGLSLTELAELMYGFGCTEAYNLDGGGSAMMAYNGDLINKPWKNGRKSSDIIFIGE